MVVSDGSTGQVCRQGCGQAGAAVADHHLDALRLQAALKKGREQSRPGGAVFSSGRLIVDDLVPSIEPDAQHRQDQLVLSAHLASLMPTLVSPGGASCRENLAPDAVAYQYRRGVSER